jgi:hypothetical protein
MARPGAKQKQIRRGKIGDAETLPKLSCAWIRSSLIRVPPHRGFPKAGPFAVDLGRGRDLESRGEGLVDGDLIAIGQTVGLVGHGNHC